MLRHLRKSCYLVFYCGRVSKCSTVIIFAENANQYYITLIRCLARFLSCKLSRVTYFSYSEPYSAKPDAFMLLTSPVKDN